MDTFKRIYRVARWVMLAGFVVTIFLMLKSPAPIAPTVDPMTAKMQSETFQDKLGELQSAQAHGYTGTEVHFTSGEVNAALASAAIPAPVAEPGPQTQPAAATSAQAADQPPPLKSTQVMFERDQVKGLFLTQVYGRDVYVTVAGRLGSKDGYVTFQPTEFKIGDLNVPVSMVDPALQRKLADPENHDKLKLPEFVKGLRIENGELVITQ